MANLEDTPILDSEELKAEFATLFPQGWHGPDVMAELAPQGWADSPLARVYHPSVEQVYEESVRMHRNLAALSRPGAPPPTPEPTLEEIAASHENGPIDAERECLELVGRCLWDVFSDNHEVFADDSRLLDLGSMRSAGSFLAEVANEQGGPKPLPKPDPSALLDELFPQPSDPAVARLMAEMRQEMIGDGGYTYLDFYLGTGSIANRADLTPVYAMIFRRLQQRGMDWKYHFPRLYAVDFRPLKKMLDEEQRGDEPEWTGYDPATAFEAEQVEQQRDAELADLRESLDEGHREAVESARDAEPPQIVRAYAAVYGRFPNGWPPEG